MDRDRDFHRVLIILEEKMERLKFVLWMKPQGTAQQKGIRIVKKGGKQFPMHYEKAKLKDTREEYMHNLRRFAPRAPILGPVGIRIKFHIKTKAKQSGYKPTRPDLDNMEKLLLDCMTQAGFWEDDSQIAVKGSSKEYDKEDFIEIEVRQLCST